MPWLSQWLSWMLGVSTSSGYSHSSTLIQEPETVTDPIRILIVDDDQEFTRELSSHLASWAQVRVLTEGGEARESIERWHPDAVFLNPILPDCDGFELLDTLFSTCQVRPLVFCITSGGTARLRMPPTSHWPVGSLPRTADLAAISVSLRVACTARRQRTTSTDTPGASSVVATEP